MLPRTQEELNALLNINPETGEFMADTIKILGTRGGFPVEISLDVIWGDDNDNGQQFIAGTFATLEQWGVTPRVVTAAASAAPQSAPQAQRAPQNRSNGGGGGGQGGGCPVHGFQFAKPGFRNQGMACSAYSEQQESWTKNSPFIKKDGSEAWYCASTWK